MNDTSAVDSPLPLNDVAVVGLGVMGRNLARNFARKGFRVGGFDLDPEAGVRLNALESEHRFDISASLGEMVARLERPRRIVLLVNAGRAVDAVLDGLAPHLQEDDIVVDGGNSLFSDTDRRDQRAQESVWRFVGMGISGGSEGALLGPSMMPGGDVEAWTRLKPVLEAVAAKSESGPCVTYCGKGSAGHFVKMTHNGIEYGDMQLIAEASTLLRRGLGKSAREVGAVFSEWNQVELDSFLIDITADIFQTPDPQPAEDGSERMLVDQIVDQAGQKGTGRWTVIAAIELGVPVPTIAAAVDARALSSQQALRCGLRRQRDLRAEAAGASRAWVSGDVRAGALRRQSSPATHKGSPCCARPPARRARLRRRSLAEVARIWTAGCIIRARLLERHHRGLPGGPRRPSCSPSPPSSRRELTAATPASLAPASSRRPPTPACPSPAFAASLELVRHARPPRAAAPASSRPSAT